MLEGPVLQGQQATAAPLMGQLHIQTGMDPICRQVTLALEHGLMGDVGEAQALAAAQCPEVMGGDLLGGGESTTAEHKQRGHLLAVQIPKQQAFAAGGAIEGL